jgi:hypothetical protein
VLALVLPLALFLSIVVGMPRAVADETEDSGQAVQGVPAEPADSVAEPESDDLDVVPSGQDPVPETDADIQPTVENPIVENAVLGQPNAAEPAGVSPMVAFKQNLADSVADNVDDTFPLPEIWSEYKQGDPTKAVFWMKIKREIQTPEGWGPSGVDWANFKAEFDVSSDPKDMKTLTMTDTQGNVSKPLTFMPDPTWIDISKLAYVKHGVGWFEDSGSYLINQERTYTITGTADSIPKFIVMPVWENKHVGIRLDNVVNTGKKDRLSVQNGAYADVELIGDNELTVTDGDGAGIRVPNEANVSISGKGSLVATGHGSAPAIGNYGWKEQYGSITISDGNITAVGGDGGAGIGGGGPLNPTGYIYIRGGYVRAVGGKDYGNVSIGAYSNLNSYGDIYFSGGVVSFDGEIGYRDTNHDIVIDGPVKINDDQYRRFDGKEGDGIEFVEVSSEPWYKDTYRYKTTRVGSEVIVKTGRRAEASGKRVVFTSSVPVEFQSVGSWRAKYVMPDQDIVIGSKVVDWDPVLGQDYTLQYSPDSGTTRVVPAAGLKVKANTQAEAKDFLEYPDDDGIGFCIYNPGTNETSKAVSVIPGRGSQLLSASFTVKTDTEDKSKVRVDVTASTAIQNPGGWTALNKESRVFTIVVDPTDYESKKMPVLIKDPDGNGVSYNLILDPRWINLERPYVVAGDEWSVTFDANENLLYGLSGSGTFNVSGGMMECQTFGPECGEDDESEVAEAAINVVSGSPTVVLNGVVMQSEHATAATFAVSAGAAATVELVAGTRSYLFAANEADTTTAALQVPKNATLNIKGSGTLYAIADAAAAIGSGVKTQITESGDEAILVGEEPGAVNILSGTVNVLSGYGAGIGGGMCGPGGEVTIGAAANVSTIGLLKGDSASYLAADIGAGATRYPLSVGSSKFESCTDTKPSDGKLKLSGGSLTMATSGSNADVTIGGPATVNWNKPANPTRDAVDFSGSYAQVGVDKASITGDSWNKPDKVTLNGVRRVGSTLTFTADAPETGFGYSGMDYFKYDGQKLGVATEESFSTELTADGLKVAAKYVDIVKPSATFTLKTSPADTDDVLVTLTASEDISKPEGWTAVSGSKTKFTKTVERDSKVSVTIADLVANTQSYEFSADPTLIDLENPAIVGGDGWTVPTDNSAKYQIEASGNYRIRGNAEFTSGDFGAVVQVNKGLENVAIAMNGVSVRTADKTVLRIKGSSSVTMQIAGQNTFYAKNQTALEVVSETELTITGSSDAQLSVASDSYGAIGSTKRYSESPHTDPNFVVSVIGATLSATGGTQNVDPGYWPSGKAVDIGGVDHSKRPGIVHLSGGAKLMLNSGGTDSEIFVDGAATISGDAAADLAGVYNPATVTGGTLSAIDSPSDRPNIAEGIWKAGTKLEAVAQAATTGNRFTGFTADVSTLQFGERGSGSAQAWRTQRFTMPDTAVNLSAGYEKWIPQEGVDYTTSGSPTSTEFVVRATSGHQIARSGADSFGESLTKTTETANGTLDIVVQHPEKGEVSTSKTLNYVIDKTLPEIRLPNGTSEYVLGSGKDLVFSAERDFSLFSGQVWVDETALQGSDFKAESGSTRITLLSTYLESLSVGKHQLQIGFTNLNSGIAEFTIAAAPVKGDDDSVRAGDGPAQGDNAPAKGAGLPNSVPKTGAAGGVVSWTLWLSVVALACGALIAFGWRQSRKSVTRHVG